jgi:hypothetical protein
VNGEVPDAETLNVALPPSCAVAGAGCEVIDGALTALLTVRYAPLLVAAPALFETTTV